MNKRLKLLTMSLPLVTAAFVVPVITSSNASSDVTPNLLLNNENNQMAPEPSSTALQHIPIAGNHFEVGANHSGIVNTYRGTDYLFTWGDNSKGQLGDGTTDQPNKATEVLLPYSDVKDLYFGGDNSSAILLDSENKEHFYVWGDNTYGQVGNFDYPYYSTPQELTLPEGKIKYVEVGRKNIGVVLTYNGFDTLYMIGDNSKGQLATTLYPSSANWESVPLPSHEEIIDFSLYDDTVSVITQDDQGNNTMLLWGDVSKGQLGNMTVSDEPLTWPTELDLNIDGQVKEVALGADTVTVGVDVPNSDTDILYYWGANKYDFPGSLHKEYFPFPQKLKYYDLIGEVITDIQAGENQVIVSSYSLIDGGEYEDHFGNNIYGQNDLIMGLGLNYRLADIQIGDGGNHTAVALYENKTNELHFFAIGKNDFGQISPSLSPSEPLTEYFRILRFESSLPAPQALNYTVHTVQNITISDFTTTKTSATFNALITFEGILPIDISNINPEDYYLDGGVTPYSSIKFIDVNAKGQVEAQFILDKLDPNEVFEGAWVYFVNKPKHQMFKINLPTFETVPSVVVNTEDLVDARSEILVPSVKGADISIYLEFAGSANADFPLNIKDLDTDLFYITNSIYPITWNWSYVDSQNRLIGTIRLSGLIPNTFYPQSSVTIMHLLSKDTVTLKLPAFRTLSE